MERGGPLGVNQDQFFWGAAYRGPDDARLRRRPALPRHALALGRHRARRAAGLQLGAKHGHHRAVDLRQRQDRAGPDHRQGHARATAMSTGPGRRRSCSNRKPVDTTLDRHSDERPAGRREHDFRVAARRRPLAAPTTRSTPTGSRSNTTGCCAPRAAMLQFTLRQGARRHLHLRRPRLRQPQHQRLETRHSRA